MRFLSRLLLSPTWLFEAAGFLRGRLSFDSPAGSLGFLPLVAAAISAGATIYAANKNSKAIEASKPQPLDISKVISDARESARSNFANSIGLEQQYRPGTAALRTTTDAALGNLASGFTPGLQARQSILDSLGGNYGTNSLLEESASRILNNLRLGGALGADVQAQAVKAALEKGGAAGISGSGAVRGLVARDLGLTSLGLEQQRIQQAQDAGQRMAALNLQDLSTRSGIALNAANQDISRTGLLASIIDSRALPESGLSPGAVANLYVGDKNAQDQATANAAAAQVQNRNNLLNSLLGFGSAAVSSGGLSGLGGLFGSSSSSKQNTGYASKGSWIYDVPLGSS